jgi:von Willebrand factor type A domain
VPARTESIAAAAATIAIAALALISAPPSARAQGEPLTPTARGASVLLLMDASGSMAGPAGGGERKIDAARTAVGELLESLAPETRVGLRLFGGGASGRTGCRDTAELIPFGPVRPEEMTAELDRYEPDGTTPLGLGLREAARDLPRSGVRAIVLVSDGQDRCAPPEPCQVAESIAGRGVDIRIEAIGFRVTRRARAELRCIARAGGGIYRDAGSADELSEELRALATRALRTYEPLGIPVDGGPRAQLAAEVDPGQYLDEIRPGEEKWYAIDLVRGETLTAGATLVPPGGIDIGAIGAVATELEVALVDPALSQLEQPGTERAVNLFFGRGDVVESVGTFGLPVGFAGEGGGAVQPDASGYAEEGTYHVRVSLVDNATGELAAAVDRRPLPLELIIDVLGREGSLSEPIEGVDDEADETSGDEGPSGLAIGLVAAGLGAAGLAAGVALGRRRGARE